VVTQLRGMLSAEQSAEVSKENQNHHTVGPEVTEPVSNAIGSR
jgi:hypothetical protein